MIAAVVPAAGLSARMGQPKLLMKFEGETLIHRVVTALRRGGAGRVVVVAPPAECARRYPDRRRSPSGRGRGDRPRDPPGGNAAVGRAGAHDARGRSDPAARVLDPRGRPGDHADLVARLSDAALGRPGCIVAPEYEGRRGHPLVLPWSIALEIRVASGWGRRQCARRPLQGPSHRDAGSDSRRRSLTSTPPRICINGGFADPKAIRLTRIPIRCQ